MSVANWLWVMVSVLFPLAIQGAVGSTEPFPATIPETPRVKYKSGKALNFEEILVQGQLKRPEIAVVTGDGDQSGNGLLRLRTDFLDRMAIDSGEAIP